jgi:hypothetical protein
MVMPDFAAMGMQPLSLLTAAGLLALLLIIFAVAVRRSGSLGSIAALFAVPALVVIAWSAWNFAEHSILRQRGMEREALNARALQLNAAAVAPGSPLACLDGGAADVVEASCEAAIFLKPETVAAATAYVEAKLRLLADSLEFAHRTDPAYYSSLTQLRNGIETDRYGFVAHVLMTRDGCTADSCSRFAGLLRDPGAVKANINAQKLENTIARYATTWNGQKGLPAAAAVDLPPPAAPPGAIVSSVPVTRPIDFPSAASIPPVNIMTDAPTSGAAAVEAAPPSPAPPARRPPASAAPARAPANPPPAAANPAARPQ